MLTKRERDCLGAIDNLTVDGVGPNMGAVADALGLASKSGVHRLYGQMESLGYLRFDLTWHGNRRGPELTPKALRLLGKIPDLSAFSDAELAAELSRRSETVRAA